MCSHGFDRRQQVTQIIDRCIGLDNQIVFDRRRDCRPALRRHKVDRSHPALHRAVDVDVEVVADEEHGIEVDIERLPQRLEDRSLRFAFAVFVRENHRVEAESEAIEDGAEGVTGGAPGVADQSQPVAARSQIANELQRAGNDLGKKLENGEGVGLLERLRLGFVELELHGLEEMIDLLAA